MMSADHVVIVRRAEPNNQQGVSVTNKVTPERIKALLATSTCHFNRLYCTTTVCQVVLQNGFTVAIGTSSCVDKANFDEKLGRQYAKEDALKKAEGKLWELEGYRLSQELRPC